MHSFWEKQELLQYDVAIIGAGITGLSTAACIREQRPDLSVVVLERGLLPTGASTKNAGFACFGSLTELLADIEVMGPDQMLELVEMRLSGLRKTRDRLGDQAIDLQVKGGYELLPKGDDLQDQLHYVNNILSSLLEKPVFRWADEQLKEFRFQGFDRLIFNQYEGQLNTGKLIGQLWQYCAAQGVRIITGAEVTAIQEEENEVRLQTPSGAFAARQVGICTNAFTRKFLQVDLAPGRGMVLAIEPEAPLPFEGTFHYDEGYYYFRDFYGKLIFGGGRNLDKATETTEEFGMNEQILKRLHDDLHEKLLPGVGYRVVQQWSGIMAFGDTKQPIIQQVSDRMAIGVRLGGMGVAIGSCVGEELAQLLVQQ